MKKTKKSTKIMKVALGLGTLVAIALPASIAPAYSYDPSMPVPAGIRSEAEMQGGLNYKHAEDDLQYRHYLQDVNNKYREYSDYGRKFCRDSGRKQFIWKVIFVYSSINKKVER